VNRVYQIVLNEWAEVFKNRFVLFTVAFLPLLAAALPLGILYAINSSPDFVTDIGEDIPAGFAALCNNLTGEECAQYFLISQFILLFMLLPLAIPITIASYSIIGEKTTRTLEPLLATCAVPEVGLISAPNMRRVVVFPAPFGPRKPKTSPGRISNSRASTAVMSSNCFVNPSMRIIRRVAVALNQREYRESSNFSSVTSKGKGSNSAGAVTGATVWSGSCCFSR